MEADQQALRQVEIGRTNSAFGETSIWNLSAPGPAGLGTEHPPGLSPGSLPCKLACVSQ